METQEILDKEIGEIEKEPLKPGKVKIVGVRIEEVSDKKNKKVIYSVNHPDIQDNIDISSVQYIRDKVIKQSGLWVKFDADDKIQKGTALARFITFLNCTTIQGVVGKDIITATDDKGYLVFKAY